MARVAKISEDQRQLDFIQQLSSELLEETAILCQYVSSEKTQEIHAKIGRLDSELHYFAVTTRPKLKDSNEKNK